MPTRVGRTVVLVALLLLPTTGASSAPADVADAAVQWLEAQQNADGSWGATEDVRVLATSEAVIGLRAYGRPHDAYFRGVTWLENHAMSSVDDRARRILALGAHGDNLSADEQVLADSLSQESTYGDGWGLSSVYAAAALDTALVLQAARTLGFPASLAGDLAPAVGFLLNAQLLGTDDGWTGTVGTHVAGDPVITALVLQAYEAVYSQVTGHELSGDDAAAFLLATVTSSSSALQQAQAAVALLRWYPGFSLADGWIANLEALQQPGGSWDGDAYVTATVLRALAAKLGTDSPPFLEAITVPDLELRAAINLALGKNRVDAITRGEIRTLTSLNADRFGIQDLTGIEEAWNLTSIRLIGNPLFDVSLLDTLPNLTQIVLADPCDLNADELIDLVDVVLLLRSIRTQTLPGPLQMAAADVAPPFAPDGEIGAGDAVAVMRAAGGRSVAACGN